jgi:N-acetylmuramoyl-L-alanine amidase
MINKQAIERLVSQLGFQPVLYVDDGHGYDPFTGVATTGKRTPQMPEDGKPIYENEFNHAVAEIFGNIAELMGFRVVYTSPELTDTSLATRIDRANADWTKQRQLYPKQSVTKLGAFISFHYNAFNGVFDKKAGGVEVHHFPGSTLGADLAMKVLNQLAQGTPQVNRGVKQSRFWVLQKTWMPSILIEAGFMDKLDEAKLMRNNEFQFETATQALKAVCEYFGVEYATFTARAYHAVDNAKKKGVITVKDYWLAVMLGVELMNPEYLVEAFEK